MFARRLLGASGARFARYFTARATGGIKNEDSKKQSLGGGNKQDLCMEKQDAEKEEISTEKEEEKSRINRSGDHGKSTVLTGEVLSKDHKIFNAIGATEELLSYLGLAREYAVDSEHDYIHKLKRIQTVLIIINSAISRFGEKELKKVPQSYTLELENWIEKITKDLPPAELYIIPGGGMSSASLHVSRALCRRAERLVVPLVREGGLDPETQVYLNRLSDYLFVLSRLAAKLDKRTESIYIPQSDEKLQMQ